MLTSAQSVRAFFDGQLEWMASNGFDVHVASAPGPGLDAVASPAVTTHEIRGLERSPSLARDLAALARLFRLIRRLQPKVVNAGTPKAGIMAMMSAAVLRVPARIYTLHGLRFETASGVARSALVAVEGVACRLANCVLCVSHGVEAEAVRRRIAPPDRAVTLNRGSVNGIDVSRFDASPLVDEAVAEIRRAFDISAAADVVGFVGRLTQDKGIGELIVAFDLLRVTHPEARLVLVGEFEPGDPVPLEIRNRLRASPGVVMAGYVEDPVPWYHLMDVVVLPTHREGFPLAALEAAAAGKPMVTTDATGARDAALQGVAGVVVETGDALALCREIGRLLGDAALRQRLGAEARRQVAAKFQQRPIWEAMAQLYRGAAGG